MDQPPGLTSSGTNIKADPEAGSDSDPVVTATRSLRRRARLKRESPDVDGDHVPSDECDVGGHKPNDLDVVEEEENSDIQIYGLPQDGEATQDAVDSFLRGRFSTPKIPDPIPHWWPVDQLFFMMEYGSWVISPDHDFDDVWDEHRASDVIISMFMGHYLQPIVVNYVQTHKDTPNGQETVHRRTCIRGNHYMVAIHKFMLGLMGVIDHEQKKWYYSHAVHDGAETIEDNRKILPKGARDFFTTRKLIGYEYTDLSQKAKADIVQVLREEDNLPASSNSSIHFLPNTPPSKLKQISRNSIQVQKTMNIAEPSDDVLDEDSHTDVDNIASDALVQDKEIMASRAESVSVVGAPVNPRHAMINLEESQRPRGRKSIRGKQSYRPRSPILAGCTRVLNATNEDLPSSATSSLAKNIPVVSRSIASTTTNSRGLDRTLVNTSDPEVNVKSSTTDTIQRYLDGLPDIDELGAPKQTSLTSRPGQQLTNTFQEKLTGGVKARPNAPKDISPVIVEISDDEVVSISKSKTMAKRAKATKDKAQSSANNLSSKYYGKSTRGIRGSRAAEEDLEDSTPKSASSQTRQELMTPRPRTKENGVPRISVSPLTMASSNQDSFSQKPQCKDNEKNKSHHPVRVAAESQESCYVTRDVKLRKAAVQIDRSRAPTTGPRVLIVDDNSLSGKEDDEKEEEHPSFENPKDGIAPAPPLVQKSTQPIPKPVSRFKPKVPKHRRQPNVTADSLRDAVAKNGMARVNGPPSRSAIVVDRENGAHCRPFEMSRAEPPKTVPQYSISYRDERSPTAQNPTSHGRMTSGGELTTGLRANGSGSAYRHEEISMIGPWTPANKTQVKRTSVNRKRSHESPPDEPSRKKPAQKKDNGQTSSISALPSNSSFNPPTGPKAWRDGSQGGPSARPDN